MNIQPTANSPEGIESFLDDSFFMINTDHTTSQENITPIININRNNVINDNKYKKYICVLLTLFLCSIGFIIYEHNKDIKFGFIEIGKLLS